MDVLTFLNYFELSNTFTRWQYDSSRHRIEECLRAITNRQRAREVRAHIFGNFSVYETPGDGDTVTNADQIIGDQYLAQQARALVCYKELAVKSGVEGEEVDCTLERFTSAIHGAIEG
ncbi:hypothetical protein H0H81_011332 [Sphagnurus paluster]|uniref:Uncharacterized protein n=1 Tax=Sphagnurus paluster TaxID=117069 RepID=A0A9P7GPJ8_9AGAR|nr:hypothetical protein H0H81_011332 [Sphagnurus paluster]